MDSSISDVVRKALLHAGTWDGGGYIGALTSALRNTTPNFATEQYQATFRELAVDRQWFSSLIASNLYMEGYSAGRLKQYSGVVGDDGLQNKLMRHANDEARHSRAFFDILFLVFPHLNSETFRREAEANVVDLDKVTPCPEDYPTPDTEELLNSFILMNLFEIKALYLGTYMKPFIRAYAPAKSAASAVSLIDRIAGDECHHITYTAKYIDKFIPELGADYITDLISGHIDLMNGSDDFAEAGLSQREFAV